MRSSTINKIVETITIYFCLQIQNFCVNLGFLIWFACLLLYMALLQFFRLYLWFKQFSHICPNCPHAQYLMCFISRAGLAYAPANSIGTGLDGTVIHMGFYGCWGYGGVLA